MWLLFQLDEILFGFLLLSSSSFFQSSAVPGGRNFISPPSPSPVVVCNFFKLDALKKGNKGAMLSIGFSFIHYQSTFVWAGRMLLN